MRVDESRALGVSGRFTLVTLALVAVIAFLVGAIVAGGLDRPRLGAGAPSAEVSDPLTGRGDTRSPVPLVGFADVVERVNPAIVNVDATTRGASRRRNAAPGELDDFRLPGGHVQRPRVGSGTGFIIDPDGSILTNHHVIDRAERITVTLADGRSFVANVVGADPVTDIALIKIDRPGDGQPLPVAPLGDSAMLRMGEWVCAIGNPLGYEHTVTVGVVSFVGRKLFDASLDNYIQTDAAITFGNSGGPLINARGEVVGINAAVSSRGNSIGFAVPINSAAAILPQLRSAGRVSRGFIGVALRDLDADLRESLGLATSRGAFVQDVSKGSPAERAGIRPYDVIVAIGDAPVTSDDELIRSISAQPPGTTTVLTVLRDGRQERLSVKLAERPVGSPPDATPVDASARDELGDGMFLGLTVRDLDAAAFNRLRLPSETRGVMITRVEPLSASFDANIQRNSVVLEINRQPIHSVEEFRRVTTAAKIGDVLAMYLYTPALQQREIKTVRVERP